MYLLFLSTDLQNMVHKLKELYVCFVVISMICLHAFFYPYLTILQQELDNESAEENQKQEAEVDLSQLKELPLLDIVDTLPPEGAKPMSGILLPSEATVGSSMQDPLETPFAELIEDDPLKQLREKEKSKSQGELMDDGSNLERTRTHISEREATQAGSETHADASREGTEAQQSFSNASKQATDIVSKTATDGASKQDTDITSKQPTEVSLGGNQKSMIRKVQTSLVCWCSHLTPAMPTPQYSLYLFYWGFFVFGLLFGVVLLFKCDNILIDAHFLLVMKPSST